MIVAKSSKDIQQLRHRADLGIYNIEIQLLDFEEVNIDKIEKESGLNVVNIHTPITSSKHVDIMDILDMNDYKYILELFERMNNSHEINVIFHYGKECSDFELLVSRIRALLEINRLTHICIENLPILSRGVNENDVIANPYYFKEVNELVRKLRLYLNIDRISSVFDVCHALSNIHFIKEISMTPHNIYEYFREFSDCRICHFSDCVNGGMKKEEHGVEFNSYERFKEMYKLYKRYMPQAQLVIEMQEDDYMNCINLKNTLDYINKYK